MYIKPSIKCPKTVLTKKENSFSQEVLVYVRFCDVTNCYLKYLKLEIKSFYYFNFCKYLTV